MASRSSLVGDAGLCRSRRAERLSWRRALGPETDHAPRSRPSDPLPTPIAEAASLEPSGRWKKLQAELRGLVGKAIGDYRMIEDGDA